MPKKLPVGVDSFGYLVDPDNNYLFADKTLFIKDIIEDSSQIILIARPRRWGKTLNMSMLNYFLAEEVAQRKTAGMFDPYAIAKADDGHYIKQHQGKYPVIFLSFKDVKADDFQGALNKIKGLVQKLCREHEYLADSDKLSPSNKALFDKYLQDDPSQQELEDAAELLSQLLYKHYGQQVYILIDEYDTPLNAAYNKYYTQMAGFMKNMFSAALKGNFALKKGVLTGILRISKDSMLSGLNNLEVFTLLNEKYNQYFGFTDQELDALFAEQGLTKDEEKVKKWYNGYRIGGLTLYNPWSIINSLKNNGELWPYWVNTANDTLLKEIIQGGDAEIKNKFLQLLEGKTIGAIVSDTIRYEDLQTDEVSIWSLLLYTGHLTPLEVQLVDLDYYCRLAIPNQEILALYKSNFIEWFHQPSKRMQLKFLLENLVKGNVNQFTAEIGNFLLVAAGIHDYATQPEAFYHGFVLALTASMLDDYYVDSNKESGFGRPDLLFIPKDNSKSYAIILEFKHVDKNQTCEATAKSALQQIDAQAYAVKIKQYTYIKTIHNVGLAFDGKKVCCESAVTLIQQLQS